jgi:hypothetical protein
MHLSRRVILQLAGLAAIGGLVAGEPRTVSSTPFASRDFGCFCPAPTGTYKLGAVEAQVGRRFDWYSTFLSLDSVPEQHSELMVAAQRHNVMVAMAPTRTIGLSFADILAGGFDDALGAWFRYLDRLPSQVVVRWAWEMNGSWMQYSPIYTGESSSHCRSSAEYAAVWRYVVQLQRRVSGRGNIRWFFCANANDAPSSGPPMESFYPGSEFVDIVGYDSYNSLNGRYMSALDTLAGFTNNREQERAYDRVTRLHPTAPVWIGETGCVEAGDSKDVPPVARGHSKADYWAEFFSVTALPRLTTVCFFDAPGTRDWRFDTSAASLAAFRSGFSDGR